MITIAIDGPGSSGKGTVAREVARRLDLAYIDTGAMYRSVALVARERGVSWRDPAAVANVARSLAFTFNWDGHLLRVGVNGQDVSATVRTAEIGAGASVVSSHPSVRSALLAQQRALAEAGGIVMDGRDIGTVVAPCADLKVYLDASLRERAKRRYAERAARSPTQTLAEVEAALEERDRRDMEREVAPLRQADDARYLDSTTLTPDEVIGRIVGWAEVAAAGLASR